MNPASSTILALASAPGFSPRAILRASGPSAGELLDAITESPIPRARGAYTSRLRLTDHGPALPALVCRFLAPHSYTGEHSFELQIPGNPTLVDRLLQRLLTLPVDPPARLAGPGEFTARAFMAGKLTLDQAEGVAAIISARSRDQLDAARRLLAGSTGAAYRAWADELLTLLALVEAGIDFTDQEDVVAIDAPTLDARLARLESQIAPLLAGAGPREAAGALPVAALVGPPNAGKSTLFNTLLGRRRAVVSDIPGTTRDCLRETLELGRAAPGAGPVELMDLPGLDPGATLDGPSAAAAQHAARHALAHADIIIHCDPSGRFEPIPDVAPAARTIRVRTKADLPGPRPDTAGALAVCALDGWHLGPLRRALADAAVGGSSAAADAISIPRHRRALFEAGSAIRDCRAALRRAGPRRLPDPELLAESLRRACDALGELTGRVAPDDVLGRIFSTFCVGK